MEKPKLISILLIGICLVSLIYVVADTVDSFLNQDNPFNISFTSNESSIPHLDILRYSYVKNITLNTIGFSITTPSLENDTVAYYAMEDSANDSTIYNNNGSILNLSFADGFIGKSAIFNGSSYIEINNSATVNNFWTNGASISGWIKIDGFTGSFLAQTGMIMNKRSSGEGWYIVADNVTDTTYRLRFHIEGNDGGDGQWETDSNFTLGEWSFFTLIYNSTDFPNAEPVFYMNNELSTIRTNIPPFSTAGDDSLLDLRIGSTLAGGQGLNGSIDEIGMLNITLNESKIEALHNLGSGKTFPFNETNFPENLTIFIDEQLQWNFSGIHYTTTNVSLNTTKINEILDSDCDCNDCSINGAFCRVPINFSSKNIGTLQVNLTNATIYTNLTINIYDREKNTLIEELTQIQIKSYNNYSTSTGIVNIDVFSTNPGPYTIIAESDNYITDQKQFTLTDKNSTTVNIYLFNSTSTDVGNLIVQTFDEFFSYIVGANVKLLEYKPTLDSFVEVSQCFSDSNGECIFDVELDTTYYIIQATYTRDEEVLFAQSTEEGQLIKIDNTIIELHLKTTEEFEVEDLFDLVIIPSNTELTGNTSFLTATFNDNTNRNHTVCVGYYTKNGLNEVEQDITCVTASAGIVNYAGGYLLDRSFTWIAKIYVIEENGKERVYNSYTYDATEDTFLSSFEGYLLRPLLFAILLALLGLSLYLKNMKVFAFATMGFSPLTLVFYPNYIGGITMSFIIILCICILYLSAKKQEFG